MPDRSPPNQTMRHSDFYIGLEFFTATGRWRCTDVGSRVVIAIRLDAPDTSWYHGPPYAVAESVLDENDVGGCSLEADTVAGASEARHTT
jgi:hypothetical protein